MPRNFAQVSQVIQFQFLCLYNQRGPHCWKKRSKTMFTQLASFKCKRFFKILLFVQRNFRRISTIINILVRIKHRVRWRKSTYSYPDIAFPEMLIQLLPAPPALAKNMTPSSCQIDCCQFQVTNTQQNLQLNNNQQQKEMRLAWKEIEIYSVDVDYLRSPYVLLLRK